MCAFQNTLILWKNSTIVYKFIKPGQNIILSPPLHNSACLIEFNLQTILALVKSLNSKTQNKVVKHIL